MDKKVMYKESLLEILREHGVRMAHSIADGVVEDFIGAANAINDMADEQSSNADFRTERIRKLERELKDTKDALDMLRKVVAPRDGLPF